MNKEICRQKFKCAVAGALAGAANGLFGAGGGVFIVPLLLSWIKTDAQKAYATSVAIILPLCAVSAAVYIARDGLDLKLAAPYLLGGIIGGVIGGRVFKNVPPTALKKAFGILLIIGGIRSALK